MPRRVIMRRAGARIVHSRKNVRRTRRGSKYNPRIEESQGILGSGAMAITGPTTTVEYIKLVKSMFIYEPSIYKKFVTTMTDYQKGRIDIVEALNTVVVLFDGYPNLIRDFNVFLPDEYALEIQEDAVVIKVYENLEQGQDDEKRELDDSVDAMGYIAKVKNTFAKEPEKYEKFTRILTDYHKKRVNEVDTVQRIVALLRHHSYLVLNFNKFLPDGHEIHMYDNSSYVVEFPVTDGRRAISIRA